MIRDKIIRIFFVFLAAVPFYWGITGRVIHAQTEITSLQFTNPEQDKVVFPFKFINNLIIIPIQINNSDSLHFILDTGLSISILTELSMGDSLSLNYAKQVKLTGLGKGDPIDALHSYGNVFSIQGVTGRYQHIYIVMQNVFNLSALLGTRVHGLIGYNLFKDFVVEINYDKKLITLHRPDRYRFRSRRKSSTIPMIIDRTKPYLYADVIQAGSAPIRVKLLLDTGASHALWLDVRSDHRLELPALNSESYLGTGLNGEIQGKVGRIEELRLDKFTFQEPIVAFPDSSSAGDAFGMDGRNGSLGSEILRRFNVVIDYPHQQITLTPNKFFKDRFRVNHAGIEVVAPIPGFPYYTISSVRKDSPGSQAGLKSGDIIHSINNRNAIKMSLDDVYGFFQSTPGRRIKMVVKRNGLDFVTYFYLQKFI